ncbi:MAG: hypothetical protein SFY81_13085 [Verrucomicrobiota bacterium]|nr:hypothetical protein [Verrucomicrobiota bacterium]
MAQTGTNKVAFAWPSVVGQSYQVQYRDNMETASWMNWGGEISAVKTNTAVEAEMNGPNGRRFYRIIELE